MSVVECCVKSPLPPPPLDCALWDEPTRQRHTQKTLVTEDRSLVGQLAVNTTYLVFDIDKETNSISSNRQSISMVGCVEEDRMCLVRSHAVLKANGSMVASRIQLSALPLELLRADVHCAVVEVLLVY